MNLKSLRVFVNVLEEGTLAKASAKMNLSQSAASRLINILESEYGTELFYRDKKRLIPTRAGEIFYPEALRILSSINAIPGIFERINAEAAVPLRIICHPRLITGLILPAMIRFAKKEPDVQLKLEVHPRRYLGQRILQDNYDVGVSNLPLPIKGVEVHVISTSDVNVLLPRNHRLAKRRFLTADDMKGERYIALDETTLLRQVTDIELARLGKSLRCSYEVSSASAAVGLVKAGLGFTLADRGMLDQETRKDIVHVPWKPPTRIQVGSFVAKHGNKHPFAEAFKECLTVRQSTKPAV